MAYEKSLGLEEREELIMTLKSRGMKHVTGIIDEIVNRMIAEVLSVALPEDPDKASLKLYAKRKEVDGVVALRNAFQQRIKAVLYSESEGERK